MGIVTKLLVVLLPLALYAIYQLVTTYFLLFFVFAHPFLTRLPLEKYQELNPKYEDFATEDKLLLNEYDFVVVGGGSAGAVVANRLSENKSWKILLLEAGGSESFLTEVPGLTWNNAIVGAKNNWGYTTTPNEDGITSTAYKGGSVSWPRGKVLGGSSSINAMVYARGNKKDYDLWCDLGNVGWGYKDVLSYFKKSEDNRNKDLSKNNYHSAGGYLTVEDGVNHRLYDEVMEACKKVLPYNPDYNGEKQTGCCFYQVTTRNGQRCSTAKAFLKERRPNLHISLFSHVHKINIDPESKKVTGVLFKKGNKMKTVSAKNEVIVSAGAIGSPQLLMLSGIGPTDDLKKFDIQHLKEAPVGHNLQDHCSVGMQFIFNDSASIPFEEFTKFDTFKEYYLKKSGLLTTALKFGAFLPTTEESREQDWPEIQINMVPHLTSTFFGNREIFHIDEKHWNEELKPFNNKHGFFLLVTLLRPKSRGRLELKSANPDDHPLIHPNYFKDPEDFKPIIKALKIMKEMAETMTKYNTTFIDKKDNSCKDFDIDSQEYIECFLRKNAWTTFHPVGTCKMGPSSDSGAIVDPRLKVYGIEGLRVIDASIMPLLISGNTNAPSIMIGEKGADLIKEDWQTTP